MAAFSLHDLCDRKQIENHLAPHLPLDALNGRVTKRGSLCVQPALAAARDHRAHAFRDAFHGSIHLYAEDAILISNTCMLLKLFFLEA